MKAWMPLPPSALAIASRSLFSLASTAGAAAAAGAVAAAGAAAEDAMAATWGLHRPAGALLAVCRHWGWVWWVSRACQWLVRPSLRLCAHCRPHMPGSHTHLVGRGSEQGPAVGEEGDPAALDEGAKAGTAGGAGHRH